MTLFARYTNLHETDTGIVKYRLHAALVLVGNLDYQCRVLGKEKFHDILLDNTVEVNFHTAGRVRETHLKESCDETTGRYIMTCHYKALINKFLHSIECLGEIFGVGNCRNIVTHAVEGLRKCRTAQTQVVEAEVDMIECTLGFVQHYRRNHLAYIRNLAAG